MGVGNCPIQHGRGGLLNKKSEESEGGSHVHVPAEGTTMGKYWQEGLEGAHPEEEKGGIQDGHKI